VGESIAKKIVEFLQTGKIKTFENLKKQVPFELLELLEVEGIGPATLRVVHDKLHINSKEQLMDALEKGKLDSLKGLAAKKIENLKRALKLDTIKKRLPLAAAEKTGNSLLTSVKKIPGIIQCQLAGSLRRKKETVGDIDIVITADEKNWKKIINAFVQLPPVEKVLAAGRTRASVVLKKNHVQVDIRIVHEHEFGAALFYFTGSKEHNILLRTMAKRKGWKINEYGVFDEKTGKRLAGRTEEEIYSLFNLPFIPPEQRLGRKELDKAS
jgi:DNA polymerase (family 10)